MLSVQDIADMIDHSLLRPELTDAEVIEGCRIAREYRCVSVWAGAVELDMVLNIGKLRSAEYSYVEEEIRAVCVLAHGARALVKVILENAYLTDDQKVTACRICERAGADFVKTSTGFAKTGATIEDLKLMRASCSERVRIKAAGGVRTLDDALAVRAAGTSRFGATQTIAILTEAADRAAQGRL
jgi:deoxyribose-phosphate aldolase